MRLFLEVISGKYAAKTIALEEGDICRVGRGAKADLCLPDDFELSDFHFALSFDGYSGKLFDLGSSSGTVYNGERVNAADLETNSHVFAGGTNFAVFLEGSLDEKTLETPIARLTKYLQSQELQLFCLLDAARDEKILPLLKELLPNFQSLYQGDAQAQLAHVAPYLIAFQNDLFLETLLRHGWGKRWMTFCTSAMSITDVRKHFRRFIFVKDERGENVYFRFYDPSILQAFLPACNGAELQQFFGVIKNFVVEDRTPAKALNFEMASDTTALRTDYVDITRTK